MDQVVSYVTGFDWQMMLFDSLRMLAAFLLVLPIGYEREHTRELGLRTFPLVAIGSCAYILVATHVIGQHTSESHPDAHTRLFQGLMTGIGFVGGGAILKTSEAVRGTATAASIWATGAVGAAVAYDRYGVAVVIALMTYLTLQFLTPFSETELEEKQEQKHRETQHEDSDKE